MSEKEDKFLSDVTGINEITVAGVTFKKTAATGHTMQLIRIEQGIQKYMQGKLRNWKNCSGDPGDPYEANVEIIVPSRSERGKKVLIRKLDRKINPAQITLAADEAIQTK